jgi:hypothetical protein
LQLSRVRVVNLLFSHLDFLNFAFDEISLLPFSRSIFAWASIILMALSVAASVRGFAKKSPAAENAGHKGRQ